MQFDKFLFKGTWGIYFQLQVDIKQKTLEYVSLDAKGNRLWSYKFKLTDKDIFNLEPYIDADDYENYAESEENSTDYYIIEFIGACKSGFISCKLEDIRPSDIHPAVQCYIYLKSEFFSDERLRKLNFDSDSFPLI